MVLASSTRDRESKLATEFAWENIAQKISVSQAKEEDTNHPGAKVEDQPVVGLPFHYNKYKESFKARQVSQEVTKTGRRTFS